MQRCGCPADSPHKSTGTAGQIRPKHFQIYILLKCLWHQGIRKCPTIPTPVKGQFQFCSAMRSAKCRGDNKFIAVIDGVCLRLKICALFVDFSFRETTSIGFWVSSDFCLACQQHEWCDAEDRHKEDLVGWNKEIRVKLRYKREPNKFWATFCVLFHRQLHNLCEWGIWRWRQYIFCSALCRSGWMAFLRILQWLNWACRNLSSPTMCKHNFLQNMF